MQRRFDDILSRLEVCHSKVLVAVSGGVDSMTLADLCANSTLDLEIGIAHCNFHLRGEESDGDEALVSDWAAGHGIPFHKVDFNTVEYAASRGLSIEMAARELRYSWFAQLCNENGYESLMVAHNANDNAETLILNLLRGTGLKGAVGMSVCSAIPSSDQKCQTARLIRPLLTFSRREIHDYAVKHGLEWREDRTNSDTAFKRNSVRNEVFPIFERMNPSFIATLNEDMGRFAEEKAASDEYFKSVAESVVRTPENGESLRIDVKSLLNTALPEYVLFRLLEPWGFNSSAVHSIMNVLTSDGTVSGKTFDAKEYKLWTTSSSLILLPLERRENQDCLMVDGDGIYSFNGVEFSVESVAWEPQCPLRQKVGTVILDASRLHFPFVVRSWKEGDWMCPLGLRSDSGRLGRKKLSDLFVDLKMSVAEKEKSLVLAQDPSQSRVVALLGKRIDEAWKVSSDSVSVIRISLKTI